MSIYVAKILFFFVFVTKITNKISLLSAEYFFVSKSLGTGCGQFPPIICVLFSLFVTLYTWCISPFTPLNYSHDGVIIFGGDAEGDAVVVVRAVVGEISVVVTSADSCVDLVHGDV